MPEQEFVTALAATRDRSGMSYRVISAALDEDGKVAASKDTVALWCQGRQRMWPDEVFAVERVLNVEPGVLSRHLGYVPASSMPTLTTEDAIRRDGRLRPRQRASVLAYLQGQLDSDDSIPG